MSQTEVLLELGKYFKNRLNVLASEVCDNQAMPYNVRCDATAAEGFEQKIMTQVFAFILQVHS